MRSFADSNGDGIGDLNGLTSKLDYLEDLGVGAIWLMPVMPSPSYHKYDVIDYKAIDAEYGTLSDFRRLVRTAHLKNIRVIIDLVVNHTSTEHRWFRDAVTGKEARYRDFYVWAKKDSIRRQIAKKTITLDSDNLTQWHAPHGDTTKSHYYGFFWGGMPDLNMDNPEVRKEIAEIGRFWLDSMEVDGFRLDAARHIYPDERAKDNHSFWIWFRSEMEKIKPDVYLVGEVWADARTVAPYLEGLPSLFNFDLAYALVRTVQEGRDRDGLIKNHLSTLNEYSRHSDGFLDAVFLRNHDQNRILSELNGDQAKLRTAVSVLMTLPGVPYLYYGEEIGMLGKKPDESIREPFLWNVLGKDPIRTRWERSVYSTDSAVVPQYLQQRNPGSLYHFYRKWIRFRNKSDLLTRGAALPSDGSSETILSFKRALNGRTLTVFHNLLGVGQTVAVDGGLRKISFASVRGARLERGRLRIPPGGSVVVE